MKLWLYRFVNRLAMILFFTLTPRKVVGSENMPESGGVVVVCNHLRFTDVFNVASCFRRRLTYMAKKELYKNKFFGYIFLKYGSFPVDREGSGFAAIRESLTRLKNGEALVIFPEGTRSRGQGMGEFKEGAVMLAAKAGVPVLPMYINSREKLFTRILVNIGKPLILPEVKKLSAEYLSQNTQMIRDKVLELRIYDSVNTKDEKGDKDEKHEKREKREKRPEE